MCGHGLQADGMADIFSGALHLTRGPGGRRRGDGARPGPAGARSPGRPGGERLDLDHAIYICLANARNRERQEQPDQVGQPADRGRVRVYEPEDWPGRIRQYYDEHPARPPRPVLVPDTGMTQSAR